LRNVLPEGFTAYKRTPMFDQDNLPIGLRREHCTKAGVWALIHVVEGRLRLYNEEGIFDDRRRPQKNGSGASREVVALFRAGV
jgi:tellurite resistance-related uncharacterized protein